MNDMEDKTKVETVPYVVHEGAMARQERTIKRLWILCLVMFLALVGTNAGWIYFESQFEDVAITQDIDQDSGGGGQNTFSGDVIGGDYYGETAYKNDNKNTP